MFLLLPKMVRNGSRWMTPLLTALARPGKTARGRKTLLVISTVLLVVGVLGSPFLYAVHQRQVAEAALKSGRPEDAKSRLRFCLFLQPNNIRLHILAARAARLSGNFEEAESHLNRCLKIHHGATEAVQLEFLLLRVQGGEEDQVSGELFAYYVDRQHPESPVILETLARSYMYHLRYGPAFTCLTRWIEVEPDSAEPLRWRGWVLERLNDYEGAIKDYKRALELAPALDTVRLRLAEMYLERSDPLSALPHLERLQKQFPDRADIRGRMGQCRFWEGKSEEARRLLESAIEQLPEDSAILVHLARLEMQEKHLAEAEVWLRRALKVDPTDTEVEYLLVGNLQAQRRYDEARAMQKQHHKDTALLKRVSRVLQQEAENPSTDPTSFVEIGNLFIKTNERIGLYWLNRALARDPANQAAHKALADFYDRKGDRDKAIYHRQQVKEEKTAVSTSERRP